MQTGFGGRGVARSAANARMALTVAGFVVVGPVCMH